MLVISFVLCVYESYDDNFGIAFVKGIITLFYNFYHIFVVWTLCGLKCSSSGPMHHNDITGVSHDELSHSLNVLLP